MTEQEQRTVYEWLYEEPGMTNWRLQAAIDRKGQPTAPVALYEVGERTFGKPLPPLDMNTWHGEVVPKLSKEADVTFRHGAWDIQSWKQAWHGPHWAREDPWQALTEYLEAKR